MMIPLIALMIGAYICTRMLELILVKQDYEGSLRLKVIIILAAAITMATVLLCLTFIFASGLDISDIR